MANQVFAMEIYDFGDAGREHRKKHLCVRHELGLWFYDAVQELENSFYGDYPCDRLGIDRYLEDLTLEDKLDYVKYFKRCRCCSRHSHYKTQAKPHDPLPESKRLGSCNCRCRRYARIAQANSQANSQEPLLAAVHAT